MKITKERAKALKKMRYGELQSTEEYKYFLSNYIIDA